MASERRLRVKTLVTVLVMVVCANAGDLLLKRGMSQIGAVQLTVTGFWHAFLLTVTNGTIWGGIFFLTGFMVSYMTVLRWIGVVLICVGVLLVGQTKPRTTAVAGEAAA